MIARGDATVDRGTIHWEARGEGPPVLLIQGVACAGQTWRPQIDGLADRYRCAWLDNRGVGGSTAPTEGLSIPRMAEDALAVMDALGWDRAHVAGHSMGGLIAQALAIRAPERVRSLALLSTFARGVQGASPGLDVMWLGIMMRVGTLRARRRAAIRLVFPDSYLAGRDLDAMHEELAAIFGRDLAAQPPVAMTQVGAMRRYDPSAEAASIAHLPALVLTGERDRIAKPAHTVELAARFGATPIVLPGSGHACTIQDADEVNRRLAEHWASAP